MRLPLRAMAIACAVAPGASAQMMQQQEQQGEPMLFKLIDTVTRSSVAISALARKHPKLTAAAVVGVAAGLYVRRELPRSGLAVRHEPHLSLAPPSDAYMCELLLLAAEAELSNPRPRITRKSGEGSSAAEGEEDDEEESEEDGETATAEAAAAAGSGRTSGRRRGVFWKCETERVVLGKGAALYRKAAADLEHFDQWDGLEGAELVLAATDDDDGDGNAADADGGVPKARVGATVGVLQRAGPFWCLSPLRIVYRVRSQPPSDAAAAAAESPGGEAEAAAADSRVYTTCYGMSTVRGAGWRGEWRFAVSYDAATDDVAFEATLHRAAGGAVLGRRQAELLARIAARARARAAQDTALLNAREKQRERFRTQAAEAERRRADKARDRVLHPEKYERKHVLMDGEDTAIRGSGRGGREARWGAARRSDDLSMRSGH
ncbi:hypothetical protein JKP88DRAFT_216467 [Tribonema minus]|uniref:DUF1990 domain-containing protein n=1 Tax=Tribonema minus TaxID=303371 RepID=A0A835YHP3_9STRA|nr:hypothetical protein JKP88DRAFT_216467 [Tribonema minus]